MIDYFRYNAPIVRKVIDKNNIDDASKQKPLIRKTYDIKGGREYSRTIEKNFALVCKTYEKRMNLKQQNATIPYEEQKLLKKVSLKMPKFNPDTDENTIEEIDAKLYTSKELDIFYKLAKEHNYDISIQIIELANKIFNLIESLVVN